MATDMFAEEVAHYTEVCVGFLLYAQEASRELESQCVATTRHSATSQSLVRRRLLRHLLNPSLGVDAVALHPLVLNIETCNAIMEFTNVTGGPMPHASAPPFVRTPPVPARLAISLCLAQATRRIEMSCVKQASECHDHDHDHGPSEGDGETVTEVVAGAREAWGLELARFDQETAMGAFEAWEEMRRWHRSRNHSKTESTLRQIVREWSEEGAAERALSFGPLLTALDEYATQHRDGAALNVLVPGAGLGRLVFEVARAGHHAEGNEFSYQMLLGSSYLLNGGLTVNSRVIAPFATTATNQRSWEDRLRLVPYPDVCVAETPLSGTMGMSAGSFEHTYGEAEESANTFDVVLCSFFLDTAHCIDDYVSVLRHCLRPGGRVISLGPALWHYSGMAGEESVDLPWAEVREAFESKGFRVLRETWDHNLSYCRDVRSMLSRQYQGVFFEAELTA